MHGFGVVGVPERAEAGITFAAGVGALVERGCGFLWSGQAGWVGFRANSTGQAGFVLKDCRCYSFCPDFDTGFLPSQFFGKPFGGRLRPGRRSGGAG